MDLSSLGTHFKSPKIFKRPATKPLLAPRGVHIHEGQLFVSDTGQNRVFIWNSIPGAENQEPDLTLGQSASSGSGRNSGGGVSPSSLHYPSGIWSDGKVLIVADAWNHRVLIWKSIPKENGAPADVVIGQRNFDQNQPNVEGIGKALSAKTLNWPYGVFSDGTSLWIADTGNRRVLFYQSIPSENFAAADAVIGKPDFSTRDYENQEPIWPYSVKIGALGEVAVADTQFYRVLIWKDRASSFSNPADAIIGQADFSACGQNQFGLQPSQKSLNWCYDTCFYKNGLLVNDTANSRILWFDHLPKGNNPRATAVIGKRDFTTGSENKDTMRGTENAIYWPFAIATEGSLMIIADTGNHRLITGELLI